MTQKTAKKQNPASESFARAMRASRQGETDLAERLWKETIAQYENTYDDRYEIPPGVLSALSNLAVLQHKEGRFDDEVRTLEKAVRLSGEFALLDENFLPEQATFQNDLAVVYSALGHLERAETLYRQALEKLGGSALKEPSEAILVKKMSAYHNLGVLYADKLGEPEKSRDCFRERAVILQELDRRYDDGRYRGDLADAQRFSAGLPFPQQRRGREEDRAAETLCD